MFGGRGGRGRDGCGGHGVTRGREELLLVFDDGRRLVYHMLCCHQGLQRGGGEREGKLVFCYRQLVFSVIVNWYSLLLSVGVCFVCLGGALRFFLFSLTFPQVARMLLNMYSCQQVLLGFLLKCVLPCSSIHSSYVLQQES